MNRASAATRERLLAAGSDVFAEKGFRGATVREIVRRAGSGNSAAIHYHFGGKEGLYSEVLERGLQEAFRKHPANLEAPPGTDPEDRLHAFVSSFVRRVFDEGVQARTGPLLTRELVEPTKALDRVVDRVFRPFFTGLCGLVRELLGPGLPDAVVRRCARSIIGQIVFYRHCAPLIERLEGPFRPTERALEELGDHITVFSGLGLRGIAAESKRRRR